MANFRGTMSETGNWNIAKSFSEKKFNDPLVDCDDLETISYFGCSSLLEEMTSLNVPLDHQKFVAFQRLIERLIQITHNSKFAMKIKGTLDMLMDIQNQLLLINGQIPKLVKKHVYRGRTIYQIKDYGTYIKVLRKVSEIKANINIPLNKNHLIFVDKEEFDPRAFKEDLKKRMVNKG